MRNPLFLLLACILLCSHDLYVKMETYFLEPNQKAILSLYNGTFEKSENIISLDRMLDASIAGHGERVLTDPTQWKDQDSTITQLRFNTGEAGTYVAGVSTKARNIELTADKFNSYLEHDGVLDMLEQRTRDNLLDQDAVESYQKHVKAIYQVGDTKTDDWGTVFGYPIEFVPQANPYEKYKGDKLEIQLLLEGEPLANQLVYADYIESTHAHDHGHHDHHHHGEDHAHTDHDHDNHDHGEEYSHDHAHADGEHDHSQGSDQEEAHSHTSGQQLKTNSQGIVNVYLPDEGIYYLRTIHMTTVADSDELTHQSKWATLTFEVCHEHDAHSHDHVHFPVWVFVVGILLLIGLLFLLFRNKTKDAS